MPPFVGAWHAGSSHSSPMHRHVQTFAEKARRCSRRFFSWYRFLGEPSIMICGRSDSKVYHSTVGRVARDARHSNDGRHRDRTKHARPLVVCLVRLHVEITSHDGSVHPRMNIGCMRGSRRASERSYPLVAGTKYMSLEHLPIAEG